MSQQASSLESRHEVERRFHDERMAGRQADDRDFYAVGGMDLVLDAYHRAIGDLNGKTVLDFGCGDGARSIHYAKNGATVYAFDISPESVRNLVKMAANAGLEERIHASVMPAETLTYADGMFDFVLGVAILHHTDVTLVEREIARVLKPGGRALFIEPLAHNPFLRLFRVLTPNRRTPTEQPMTVGQIRRLIGCFRQGGFRGFHLLSIVPPGLLWATGNRALFKTLMRVTQVLDRWLLAIGPPLRRYCWMALIDVKK
ncbi:MAG TPA: class I SAM-dependent methyltransferase [Nitrospira sp.]|jgi:SAM-dependent methyltransferase|nr:class I SAM-dependent methyltransferase [Nitrospira sp.]